MLREGVEDMPDSRCGLIIEKNIDIAGIVNRPESPTSIAPNNDDMLVQLQSTYDLLGCLQECLLVRCWLL